ncbi:hypothetical protein WT92_11615 [Burkholderia stagnalis]|uniref:Uncharacterized protein n=1 Tax=Burkholderia stagnalis TaxID=1503054 RepID=A0A107AM56_9BURK|nr:hypothetical protein WT35_24230 [Burkholderia stagnalis]KWA50558.1 hypothetical protein WT43_29095 [Burkholderia stagnalis]KWA61688.1 hypothetical protein WT42_02910 [Burkholderia stagnalis]KWA66069.1 hypothetical protein WT44_07495 [Burkholderia stagnalis]KWD04181.1 hypothetical protein WT46_14045 [Burkholderia stagnalis]
MTANSFRLSSQFIGRIDLQHLTRGLVIRRVQPFIIVLGPQKITTDRFSSFGLCMRPMTACPSALTVSMHIPINDRPSASS